MHIILLSFFLAHIRFQDIPFSLCTNIHSLGRPSFIDTNHIYLRRPWDRKRDVKSHGHIRSTPNNRTEIVLLVHVWNPIIAIVLSLVYPDEIEYGPTISQVHQRPATVGYKIGFISGACSVR
ncbi:hypothetical protein EDD22DRAFT_629675 [Suillus occidentalis]|nr:hypothetical protein EDD22DRAFT_629675 [Suillus occidentalis]